MEPDEEGGIVLTFEPLTAIAGGLIGGALVATALYAVTFQLLRRKAGRFRLG